MKILYIRLKNYASVYTGLHKRDIEIDFMKCKNKIILLVGANGSGKTSILSTLHPFAYSGNMDVRSNSTLILPEKDGYKEIHIQDGINIYKISHFYKWSKKDTLTVKSFIKKNDEELNPNGNVTSFLSIVKDELKIELEFLKLLRLGSNVTNLIEMKSTDRKKFASDLLSDINIYNDLYKKVNDDNRLLKGLIKSVSDKIYKLGVLDESIMQKEIDNMNEKLSALMSDKSKLDMDIGLETGIMLKLLPEGISDINQLYNEINKIELLIKGKENELKSNNNFNKVIISTDDYETMLSKLNKEYNDIEHSISLTTTLLNLAMDNVDHKIIEKDKLISQLKSFVSIDTLNDMNLLHSELLLDINTLEEYFNSNYPTISKSDLLMALNILNEMSEIANNIHGFSEVAIDKIFELIDNQYDISEYIHKEIDRLNMEIVNKKFIDSKESKNAMPLIMYVPSECNQKNNCPLALYYNRLILKEDDDTSLSSLEYEKNILGEMSYINSNINLIIHICKSNNDIINRVKLKYLKFDNIMDSIRYNKPIYDETMCMRLMSDIEDYEKLLEYKNKLKEIEANISNMKSNELFINSINSSIEDLNKSINKLRLDIGEYKNTIEELNNKKNFKEDLINDIKQFIDSRNKIDILENEIKQLKDSYNNYKYILQLTLEKESIIKNNTYRSDMLKRDIDYTTKEIFNKQMKLEEYIKLNNERKLLMEDYDKVSIIREALSSTKGIPLLYIHLYFKNTKIFVNELLSSIYGDDFEIDDFIINSDEFSIPYIKNGVYIDDVVYASQGERSFLSLALSFALINQSIKDYNILLLDEIDSTLDTKNRSMFLNILENQINTIDAEQVFLITHNNMFDMYPVDIILTSDISLDNYKNSNIIYKN